MDYSKVKFVTPSVDGYYFTKGKVYAFELTGNKSGHVTDDDEEERFIFIPRCAHLDNNPWIPCHEDGTLLTKELTKELTALEAEMLAMLEVCDEAISELMEHQDGWEEDYQKLQDLIKKAEQ